VTSAHGRGTRAVAAAGLAMLALLAGAWQQPAPATPQAQLDFSLPQRYTTLATDFNPSSASAAGLIEIVITRWSTDADRSQLMGTLAEKGPEEALKILKKQKPVGRLRSPGSIGQDLQFSSQEPSRSGGRDIILLADRIIDYSEIAGMLRSVEYPFLYIELHLDPKGQGSGSLLPAVKLVLGGRLLVVENYNIMPINLGSVKRER
jgi:hypothetical protein